jgi:hypothetical protein
MFPWFSASQYAGLANHFNIAAALSGSGAPGPSSSTQPRAAAPPTKKPKSSGGVGVSKQRAIVDSDDDEDQVRGRRQQPHILVLHACTRPCHAYTCMHSPLSCMHMHAPHAPPPPPHTPACNPHPPHQPQVGDNMEAAHFTGVSTAALEALGLRPHPDPVAEAASLGSVEVPERTLALKLPGCALECESRGALVLDSRSSFGRQRRGRLGRRSHKQ